MTRLALRHGAINLSQGFPDFDTHPERQDLVVRHMRAGRNQYAPMPGVAVLREAIAAKTRQSLSRHPELKQRSFVISSFAKTYHTTGWKVGYCLAPRPLSEEFRKIHQYMIFAVNTPAQWAYAEFLQDAQHCLGLPEFYQAKRDAFLRLIRGSRFRPLPCRGTYHQLLDYSRISAEPDTQFARRLTTEFGVAAIPPSVFYHRGGDHRVLRFCFAKKAETLTAAAERLNAI